MDRLLCWREPTREGPILQRNTALRGSGEGDTTIRERGAQPSGGGGTEVRDCESDSSCHQGEFLGEMPCCSASCGGF